MNCACISTAETSDICHCIDSFKKSFDFFILDRIIKSPVISSVVFSVTVHGTDNGKIFTIFRNKKFYKIQK